jgi:SAM-dependent methyltransferase
MVGVQDRDTQAAARRFRAPVVDLRVFELSTHPSPAGSVQRSLLQHAGILVCPRCGGDLEFSVEMLECKWCSSAFASDAGIPQLFFPHDVLYGPRDVTHKVKDFYEDNPFPKYQDSDSRDSLKDRSSASPLARLLDEQLPANALILDAGCGTGQLANFLSMQKDRQVIGADLSLNALQQAKRFKDRCAIQNAGFLQMNLFRPPFRNAVFDVVVASSVLHHTSDPLRGFQSLASLLKPDGIFVLSLYNQLGRAGNDLRRLFYRLTKDRLAFLRWRKEDNRARFVQRYKQPYESRHSLNEIAQEWFGAHDFEFLYSSPRIGSKQLSGGEDLRYGRWPGDRTMQLQTEAGMMLRGIVNDGLFVMIGRNKAQLKQIEAPGNDLAQAAVA